MRNFARVTRNAGFVTILGTGLIVLSATAQTPQQTNTGQQPPSASPYPSANDPLPGGASADKSGASGGDTMSEAKAMQMDKRFLRESVMASMVSIEMGKLASTKAASDSVKQFALKMAQDHTRGLEYLKKTAARDGVPVADTIDAKHKESIDKLAKTSGSEFDRAYIKYQVKHYQKRVSEFQDESDNGTETAAKTLATRMLPGVQQHLNEAKDLNKVLTAVAAK
jgi:putative membrane protein